MLIEVHRVVQNSDDLDRVIAANSIEQDVPGISTWQLDMMAQDPRPRAAQFAALGVGGDALERLTN